MEKAFLKYISFFTFSIFISVNLFGQGKTVIRGQVKDKNTNEPIPGVNVIEKNDNNRSLNGTITDANGYYMISISGDEKTELMFSFISYKSKTIAISGQKEINVQLEEDVQQIGDPNAEVTPGLGQQRLSIGVVL